MRVEHYASEQIQPLGYKRTPLLTPQLRTADRKPGAVGGASVRGAIAHRDEGGGNLTDEKA